MKKPVILKEDILNQLDQCLSNIGIDTRLGLSLSQKIADGHIATSLVIKALKECDDVDYQWISIEAISTVSLKKNSQIIFLSEHGDSFLLDKGDGQNFVLSAYFHVGEEIFRYEDTLSNLIKEFDLIDQAFVIKRVDKSKKAVKPKEDNYTYRHFFAHKSTIWSILGAAVFMALLGVATPLGFQTFTDKILPYSATGSLYVIAVFLLLSAVASSVFQCYHDFQENVLFAKYQNGLGKEVFRRLLDMDIPYFDKNKVGDLTKLVDQVEEASNFLVRQALSSVVSLISLIVVLPILFVYSMKLTAIVLGIGVFMAVTIGIALKPIRNRVMQAYTYDAGFQSTLIETLKGIKTIKSLANEAHFRNRANIALETNLYGLFNVARLSNVIRALVGFQSQLITIAVIFFGAQSVFANELSIGQLIAFNMLANNVVNPLVSLVMMASGWENFKLANRKLNELKPPASPIMILGHDDVDLNGDIVFENVWFRYPEAEDDASPASLQGEDKWVLKGVSFTIKRGEIVGIVGSSGSGKSTIAALLMGFYLPNKGKIKVNGFDISFISPKLLRSRISSVQQTSFLFNTSVMENIHLGRLSSSVEDIFHSLQDAGAEEFVDEMPHKMFTPLAEDGGNLSGGQRQRLAIARALVRQSDVLLFDEATSALDNQTEDRIKETIYHACQDKTGLIIAHRLNTLSYCHHLIVMSHGEVEVMGSHDELILLDNSYQKMWASLSRKGQPGLGPREGNMSKNEDLKDAVQF